MRTPVPSAAGILDGRDLGHSKLIVADMRLRDRPTDLAECVAAAAGSGQGSSANIEGCSDEEMGGIHTDVYVTPPSYVSMWLQPVNRVPWYRRAIDAARTAFGLPPSAPPELLSPQPLPYEHDAGYSSHDLPDAVSPFVQGLTGPRHMLLPSMTESAAETECEEGACCAPEAEPQRPFGSGAMSIICDGYNASTCHGASERPLMMISGEPHLLQTTVTGACGNRLVLGDNLRFKLAAGPCASQLAALLESGVEPGLCSAATPVSHAASIKAAVSISDAGKVAPAVSLACLKTLDRLPGGVTALPQGKPVRGAAFLLQPCLSGPKHTGPYLAAPTLLLTPEGTLTVDRSSIPAALMEAHTAALNVEVTLDQTGSAAQSAMRQRAMHGRASEGEEKGEASDVIGASARAVIVEPVRFTFPRKPEPVEVIVADPDGDTGTSSLPSPLEDLPAPTLHVPALADGQAYSFAAMAAGGNGRYRFTAVTLSSAVPSTSIGPLLHRTNDLARLTSSVASVSPSGTVSVQHAGVAALSVASSPVLSTGDALLLAASEPVSITFSHDHTQTIDLEVGADVAVPFYATGADGQPFDLCYPAAQAFHVELVPLVEDPQRNRLSGVPSAEELKAARRAVDLLWATGSGSGAPPSAEAIATVDRAMIPQDACGVAVLRGRHIGAATLFVRFGPRLINSITVRSFEPLPAVFPPPPMAVVPVAPDVTSFAPAHSATSHGIRSRPPSLLAVGSSLALVLSGGPQALDPWCREEGCDSKVLRNIVLQACIGTQHADATTMERLTIGSLADDPSHSHVCTTPVHVALGVDEERLEPLQKAVSAGGVTVTVEDVLAARRTDIKGPVAVITPVYALRMSCYSTTQQPAHVTVLTSFMSGAANGGPHPHASSVEVPLSCGTPSAAELTVMNEGRWQWAANASTVGSVVTDVVLPHDAEHRTFYVPPDTSIVMASRFCGGELCPRRSSTGFPQGEVLPLQFLNITGAALPAGYAGVDAAPHYSVIETGICPVPLVMADSRDFVYGWRVGRVKDAGYGHPTTQELLDVFAPSLRLMRDAALGRKPSPGDLYWRQLAYTGWFLRGAHTKKLPGSGLTPQDAQVVLTAPWMPHGSPAAGTGTSSSRVHSMHVHLAVVPPVSISPSNYTLLAHPNASATLRCGGGSGHYGVIIPGYGACDFDLDRQQHTCRAGPVALRLLRYVAPKIGPDVFPSATFNVALLPAASTDVIGLKLNISCVDTVMEGRPSATAALTIEEETLISVIAPQYVATGSTVRLRTVVTTANGTPFPPEQLSVLQLNLTAQPPQYLNHTPRGPLFVATAPGSVTLRASMLHCRWVPRSMVADGEEEDDAATSSTDLALDCATISSAPFLVTVYDPHPLVRLMFSSASQLNSAQAAAAAAAAAGGDEAGADLPYRFAYGQMHHGSTYDEHHHHGGPSMTEAEAHGLHVEDLLIGPLSFAYGKVLPWTLTLGLLLSGAGLLYSQSLMMTPQRPQRRGRSSSTGTQTDDRQSGGGVEKTARLPSTDEQRSPTQQHDTWPRSSGGGKSLVPPSGQPRHLSGLFSSLGVTSRPYVRSSLSRQVALQTDEQPPQQSQQQAKPSYAAVAAGTAHPPHDDSGQQTLSEEEHHHPTYAEVVAGGGGKMEEPPPSPQALTPSHSRRVSAPIILAREHDRVRAASPDQQEQGRP